MPSIILVRHGPVAVKASGLLSFGEFCAHIEAYELSGIAAGARAPDEVALLVRGATKVFASDAPRVSDSLARIGVAAGVTEARFREAPPLAPSLPLRLPAIIWLALARARGEFDPALAEARADLTRRATRCAETLDDASAQGAVALIGHGWFNRYVASRGWRKTRGPGVGRPWGHLVLSPAHGGAA